LIITVACANDLQEVVELKLFDDQTVKNNCDLYTEQETLAVVVVRPTKYL